MSTIVSIGTTKTAAGSFTGFDFEVNERMIPYRLGGEQGDAGLFAISASGTGLLIDSVEDVNVGGTFIDGLSYKFVNQAILIGPGYELFDTSDPDNPVEVHYALLGSGQASQVAPANVTENGVSILTGRQKSSGTVENGINPGSQVVDLGVLNLQFTDPADFELDTDVDGRDFLLIQRASDIEAVTYDDWQSSFGDLDTLNSLSSFVGPIAPGCPCAPATPINGIPEPSGALLVAAALLLWAGIECICRFTRRRA